MKRKRLLAFILSFILTVSGAFTVRAEEITDEAGGIDAFAAPEAVWYDESGSVYHFTGEYTEIDGECRPIYESEPSEMIPFEVLAGDYFVSSARSSVGSAEQSAEDYYYLMYNQLDESSKLVYDTLKEKYSVFQDKDAEVEVIVNELVEEDDRLREICYYAISALNMDEQKMFWLNINAIAFYSTKRTDGTTSIVFCLNEGHYDSMLSRCYSDWDAVQTDLAEMETSKELIRNMIPEDAGFYKKLEALNDYIVDYNYYNRYVQYGVAPEDAGKLRKAYIAASALTEQVWLKSAADKGDPASPVCEGYARAFKMVCDELGIPCILVCGREEGSSAGHMWNYVQNKETGIWYAVDTTWNDPVRSDEWNVPETPENYRYAYLLVGSQTPDHHDPGKTFIEKHPANGAIWTGGNSFEVPVLSETAFDKNAGGEPAPAPDPGEEPGKEPVDTSDAAWGDVSLLTPGELETLGFSKPDDIPKDLWAVGVHDTVYTGEAVVFSDLKVFHHNRLLSPTDYSIKYLQNTEVGDAKIVITGKGDYTGSREHIFKIEPIDLSSEAAAVKAPDVTVYANGTVQKMKTPVSCIVNGQWVDLQEENDFIFSYEAGNGEGTGNDGSFVTPGVYVVTVEGNGPKFKGSFQFRETILESQADGGAAAKPVSELNISVPDITIDGKTDRNAFLPDVIVEDGANRLEMGIHYNVEISRPIKVGKASVYITGIIENGYVGTAVVKCNVSGTSLGSARIEGMERSYPYEATGVTVHDKPGFRIYDESADYALQPGVDYEAVYKNNNKKGTATMTCKGIGAYTGTFKKTFKIVSCDLFGTSRITVEKIQSAAYQKGGAKPAVTVKDGLKVLKNGVDYKLSYAGNSKVGNEDGASVKITGKGNYKGSIIQYFTVTNASIQNAEVSVSDIVYTGKTKVPAVTVKDTNGKKLTAGKDYEREIRFRYKNGGDFDPKNNILNVGDVICAVVTGKGSYAGSGVQPDTKEVEFRCVNASIAKAVVRVADQSYTGAQIRPGQQDVIEIYLGKGIGKQVLSVADYEIIEDGYGTNTARGKGTMTIHGLGNYGGTKKVTFRITAKSVGTVSFLGRLFELFDRS